MAKAKSITESQSTIRTNNIESRLQELQGKLHQSYCMATMVEAALVGAECDLTPEFAVSVRQGLVMTLDQMSFELKDICAMFGRVTKGSKAKVRRRPKHQATKGRTSR